MKTAAAVLPLNDAGRTPSAVPSVESNIFFGVS